MSCQELRRAALSGDGLPSLEHVRACADCASARASVVALSALAIQLDPPAPSADRMAELRARLVVNAQARSRRVPRAWMGAALAAAFAAAAVAMISLRAPVPHGTIDAGKGARFSHPVARAGEPEIVRVFDGTVSVDVSPLGAGERFLVMTEDAEIEVRGTRFDVVVEDDRLERVWVREGRVEVRALGGLPVVLRTGDAWHRPKAVIAPASEPAPAGVPVIAPPPSIAPRARSSRAKSIAPNRDVTPHERAFRDAWAAFARGDMGQAAELFAQAEAAVPGEPLAEDACYGRAVSLERGGRRREAIAEMKRFLTVYPRAVRGDEVAVSLGLLLHEAGDTESARALFDRGAASESAEIRQSARQSLQRMKSP